MDFNGLCERRGAHIPERNKGILWIGGIMGRCQSNPYKLISVELSFFNIVVPKVYCLNN